MEKKRDALNEVKMATCSRTCTRRVMARMWLVGVNVVGKRSARDCGTHSISSRPSLTMITATHRDNGRMLPFHESLQRLNMYDHKSHVRIPHLYRS